MNKSESKYFNTALMMNEAFLNLLTVKDFDFITVKEICEKAGVNRSTFYLHYESINDLLQECLENADAAFAALFSKEKNNLVEDIPSASLNDLVLMKSVYLIPYINYIKDNKTIYKAAYLNRECLNASKRFEAISNKVLMPILDRFNIPKEDQKYFIQYYINGCHAIIREWVLNNCEESAEKIIEIILNCVRPEID